MNYPSERQRYAVGQRQQGFTLLEMLVVLVLVSLISGLLMQGFVYVLGLRSRFLAQLDRQQTEFLQERWFRDVNSALVLGLPEAGENFHADRLEFRGITLMALDEAPGVPVPVNWRFVSREGVGVLEYQERDRRPWIVGRWTGRIAEFAYLDSRGIWQSQWEQADNDRSTLPAAISFTMSGGARPVLWIVPMSGRGNRRPELRELMVE